MNTDLYYFIMNSIGFIFYTCLAYFLAFFIYLLISDISKKHLKDNSPKHSFLIITSIGFFCFISIILLLLKEYTSYHNPNIHFIYPNTYILYFVMSFLFFLNMSGVFNKYFKS